MKKILVTVLLLGSMFIGFGQPRDTTIRASVEFIVNTDSPICDGNYVHFTNYILPYSEFRQDDIGYVLLVGAASPEGNKRNNKYLAESRAQKIRSWFSFVPDDKVIVSTDYDLFLEKTAYDESSYKRLRATYVEIVFNSPRIQHDTIPITHRDTVYLPKPKVKRTHPLLTVYSDVVSDLVLKPSIGLDINFLNSALFAEANISHWKFGNFQYKILDTNLGLKKYLGKNYSGMYIEAFAKYTNYNLGVNSKYEGKGIGAGLGVGYRFNMFHSNRWHGTVFVRGGWLSHWENKYNYSYTVVQTPEVTIITPDLTKAAENYFGLFNFGMTISYDVLYVKF